MAPRKTNIKIKRSKFNLYNKKKSKAKRALKIVISIVAICGLGVLGYGLGKPLMKYFRERGNSDSNNASAIISSMINSATAGFTQSTEQSTAPATTVEEEPQKPTIVNTAKIYYLPENAAVSEKTLTSELAKAKSSGCTIVAVTMKDQNGCLQYKTSIEKLKGTDAVLANAMTAQQIVAAISKEGFTPAARINTLMDQLGCYYMTAHYQFAADQGSYAWHDNAVEKGGKTWMSPFKDESRSYIGEVTKELTNAGFKHIICANTRFPAFHSIDITTYLHDLPLTDAEQRVNALWSIIDAAKAKANSSGVNLWVEISGTSVIADDRDCTDAEIASDKAKLKDSNLVVIYDIKSAAGNTAQTGSNSTGAGGNTTKPNGSDTANTPNTQSASVIPSKTKSAYDTAKDFAAKAKVVLGEAEFAVRIPDTVTGKELTEVKRALSEAGIPVF